MKIMRYAKVVVFKKLGEFDEALTYSIPEFLENDCKIGSFAEIQFRSKTVKGIIAEISENPPTDIITDKIKPVLNLVSDCSLLPQHLKIAFFISEYYQTSLARSLRLFVPKQMWNGNMKAPFRLSYKLLSEDNVRLGEKQKKLTELIRMNDGEISKSSANEAKISATTLKSLMKKGAIKELADPIFKPINTKTIGIKDPSKILTSDQEDVLKKIESTDKPILLHGITGSGKTEIYLRRILNTIKSGKQAIILVPEIALTPQTINYFKEYIGDHVAVFHSKLNDGQRTHEWWKVRSGNAPLIIGSRSAIFAPVTNLGLIIIDEEHEWTYKQESAPYYETQKVAEEMQKLWKAEFILGSATPKAESYEKAKEGKYIYLELRERIFSPGLPKIQIVDLRDEFKKRNFSIFSLLLQNKIKDRLDKNEQVILFVNQRGLANAVVCRDCGYAEKCPNCDISLKLHRSFNDTTTQRNNETTKYEIRNAKSEILICHYCNYTKEPPLLCPECKSPYIKNIGVGTQRVEEEVKRLFPKARVIRADRDTTESNEGFSPIYKDFSEHKYDILVGTQMIAKGLDFAKVSLIGIILADIGLHIPDFRSSERLFQILTQVSGRCGRRDDPGEVILQTYNPEHPTLLKAANYEYNNFIENELKTRLKLNYPPFTRMVKFTVVGTDKDKLSSHIKTEQETLEDIFKINNLNAKIVSAPAMVAKVSNRYYYHVLLRSDDPERIFAHWKPPKGWRIDVDPVHTT